MTLYLVGTNEIDALTDPDGGQFSTAQDALDYAHMKSEYAQKTLQVTYQLKVFVIEVNELPKAKD